MNIMNKLYKCALGLLTTFILTFCCISSADDVEDLITKVCTSSNPNCSYFSSNQSITSSYQVIYTFDGTNTNVDIRGHTVCVKFSNWSTQSTSDVFLGFANNTNNARPYNSIQFDQNKLDYQCIYVNSTYSYMKAGVGAGTNPITVNMELFVLDDLLATALPKLTSLECQTEYNLIPISEITSNYCKLNFDLIDPAECPIQPSGSGAVNWSSLFINGTQYPGNASISVYIPEYIGYSITYNDDENLIDIEGYNADESYIEGVINNEKLTPTNEDITLLFTGLVNFIPYLFIGLLIIRAVKIFSRIWR